ncbi:hypothetical protein [Microcella sp.]|uniref:hypothetical protein n=1 Tax=Microcella sp. TaxID=1913979 RepID=UPI0039197475
MQQERRRAVHAELRAILDEQLGPQPLPGLIYRQGNDMKDEIFALSPPVEIIGSSLALVLSIPFALAEFTGRQELILLVLASIMVVVPMAFLVRGLIRIRWWLRARRIALKWCAENNHVMPHDLRW